MHTFTQKPFAEISAYESLKGRVKYPYILLLPQRLTEKIIEQELTELGVKVQRGVEFEGLRNLDNGVAVKLSNNKK